jgi:hypothetical protein
MGLFFSTPLKKNFPRSNIRGDPYFTWGYFRDWGYIRGWGYFRENTVIEK